WEGGAGGGGGGRGRGPGGGRGNPPPGRLEEPRPAETVFFRESHARREDRSLGVERSLQERVIELHAVRRLAVGERRPVRVYRVRAPEQRRLARVGIGTGQGPHRLTRIECRGRQC